MKMKLFDDLKVDPFDESWFRTVEVAGVCYRVGRYRASGPRRIAYSAKRGYRWAGVVMRDGRTLWSNEVPKSIGVRGILLRAGVLQPRSDSK